MLRFAPPESGPRDGAKGAGVRPPDSELPWRVPCTGDWLLKVAGGGVAAGLKTHSPRPSEVRFEMCRALNGLGCRFRGGLCPPDPPESYGFHRAWRLHPGAPGARSRVASV